jgi:hypothetical protein
MPRVSCQPRPDAGRISLVRRCHLRRSHLQATRAPLHLADPFTLVHVISCGKQQADSDLRDPFSRSALHPYPWHPRLNGRREAGRLGRSIADTCRSESYQLWYLAWDVGLLSYLVATRTPATDAGGLCGMGRAADPAAGGSLAVNPPPSRFASDDRHWHRYNQRPGEALIHIPHQRRPSTIGRER